MMEITERLCPACASANPAEIHTCCFCGYDLKNDYSILPDGLLYGVAIGNDVAIKEVESFKKAQKLANILNKLKRESTQLFVPRQSPLRIHD